MIARSSLSHSADFLGRHSVKRSGSIECAFGLLKGKWRILKRGMHMKAERCKDVISVSLRSACEPVHFWLIVVIYFRPVPLCITFSSFMLGQVHKI